MIRIYLFLILLFLKPQDELLSNERDEACSLLTRSLSSSDLKSASESVKVLTSSKTTDRSGKGGKGSRKYNKRLSQKHYHTMQISYPIDEPSALLPVDVDPPFEGEIELELEPNKSTLVHDAVDKDRKSSTASSDMSDDKENKQKSSSRRYIRQISSSLTRQEKKASSLPPEDHLGAVGGLPILPTTSSSSNETSPASSSANSPDIRNTETKTFFPSSYSSKSKLKASNTTKSVRSKSEDAKSRRNKNSVSRSASSLTSSQQVQTSPSLPDDISHSTRRILAMEDQKNLDWQTTKSSLTQRAAHLLESGLWTDCEFHVGLPPNVKVS